MKSKILILMLLCAALVVFPSRSYTAERTTEEDAVQMVEMAGKLIEVMGDAALAVISDPSGKCCDQERNLYVFVYSKDVVLLADSQRHDVIGVSFKGKDPVVNNYQVSEIMVQKAMKKGSGWTDYPYMNASTGKISMKHTYAKLFRHAGKSYIVCCGVWHDDIKDVVPQEEPVVANY
jgi:Single Cache domain 2